MKPTFNILSKGIGTYLTLGPPIYLKYSSPRNLEAVLRTAIEVAIVVFPPILLLFGVPSSLIRAWSIAN